MDNEKFQKGIREIKNITLGGAEKKRIFEAIVVSPPPTKETLSPFSLISPFKILYQRKYFYYVALPCLILILSGGGAVWASQDALPGDALYGLKTKVVEPTVGTFKQSPEAKVRYQGMLAIERFKETEKLIEQDRLDETTEEEIGALLFRHSENFDKAWKRAKNPERETLTNFGEELKGHEIILGTLNSPQSGEETMEEKVPGEQAKKKVPDTVFRKVEDIKKNIKEKREKLDEISEDKEEKTKENIKEEILPGNPLENLGL